MFDLNFNKIVIAVLTHIKSIITSYLHYTLQEES